MVARLTYQSGVFRINELSIDDYLAKLAVARTELGVNNPAVRCDPVVFAEFYAEHLKCTEPIRIIARHWEGLADRLDELLLFYSFVPDYAEDSRVPMKHTETASELEFKSEMSLEKTAVPPEIKVVHSLGGGGSVSCSDGNIWNGYIETVRNSVIEKLKVFSKGTKFKIEYSNFAVRNETEYYQQ